MPNPQRFYRNIGSLDDAKTAIHELTDHVYSLRETVDSHKKTIEELHGKLKAKNGKPGFTQDIAGVKIKQVTDSLTLKNGYTLRYNDKTGEFEFGV